MLVNGLPVDSAFHRQGKLWTQAHELAAMAVDKLESRLATLTVIQVDRSDKDKIPKPIVVTHPDRPQAPTKAKKKVGAAGLASLFGGGGK